MRKLLKKLQKWYLKQPFKEPILSKWQRELIYDFIIEYIEEVTKK